MSSYIGDIADAVASALTAAGLSQSFTAERVYLPEREFKNETDLVVEVFARQAQYTRQSRNLMSAEIEIDVMFWKHMEIGTDATAETANAELDALMQLGEEIVAFLSDVDRRYANARASAQSVPEFDPIYDFEKIRENRTFVGLIKAYFIRA